MKKGSFLLRVSLMVLLPILAAGCLNPKIKLFTDETDPLQEFTLEGTGAEKVLVVPVEGFLSDQSRGGVLRRHPGAVQALVSQIRKAKKDKKIRAVVLKVNSPGGTVTASDILHHELVRYKTENGVTIVAVMMDVAASGGYYIALPADHIVAHPTSLTGSVGVIFAAPRLSGLMDKVGVDVHVVKSGRNKDMGSPFRETTPEENALFQDIIGNWPAGSTTGFSKAAPCPPSRWPKSVPPAFSPQTRRCNWDSWTRLDIFPTHWRRRVAPPASPPTAGW